MANGSLRIQSDDPGEPVSIVHVFGNGLRDPEIELAAESLDFGEVRPGETLEKMLEIRNTGTTLLLVSSATISGRGRRHYKRDLPQGGLTIEPSGKASIPVRFSPLDDDEEKANIRLITSDVDETTVIVDLAGKGLSEPDLAYDVNAVTFGEAVIGTRVERSLLLQNAGTARLRVESIRVGSPRFGIVGASDGETAAVDIEPGDELSLDLWFQPDAPGESHTTLVIESTDPGEPRAEIELVGHGLGRPFVRSDCNGDGRVDISDSSCTLNWLFLGAENLDCVAAANANADESVDISDASFMLNFLFLGGAPPALPFPTCGGPEFERDLALRDLFLPLKLRVESGLPRDTFERHGTGRPIWAALFLLATHSGCPFRGLTNSGGVFHCQIGAFRERAGAHGLQRSEHSSRLSSPCITRQDSGVPTP